MVSSMLKVAYLPGIMLYKGVSHMRIPYQGFFLAGTLPNLYCAAHHRLCCIKSQNHDGNQVSRKVKYFRHVELQYC